MTEPALTDRIALLSPKHSQKAALAVYEQLPDQLWTGEERVPLEDLSLSIGMFAQSSTPDVSAVVHQVLEPGSEELKGDLAKAVLLELAGQSETETIVSAALDATDEPDMLPLPLIIGAVLIYLARLKTKEQSTTVVDPRTGVETTSTTVERQNLSALADLTGHVSEIMSKLKGG